MDGFAAFSYRLLGRYAEPRATPEMQTRLLRAHLPMRAAAFLAAAWMASGAAALVGALLALLLLLGFHAHVVLLILGPLMLGGVLAGWVWALAPAWVQNRAREIEKDIDENLPAGLNYMLALANAGLPPTQMWGSLANATVFGALATEAARIRRDLSLFSMDALSAMRAAQERTPSKRFREFLQGAISSFQSGVELEVYLKTKCAQYQHSATEEQATAIETMGVMAEAFLVVVVAAPLFLIILITVMAVNQGVAVIKYGFLLSLIFIPLAQLLIGTLMSGSNPRSLS